MSKAASGAMTTKAKAMFAKRLSESDYLNLSNKKSVSEIATYLKNETYYASCLEGINEKALHRGQLEALIRNDYIDKVARILRYSTSDREGFEKVIVVQSEVNTLITITEALISNDFTSIIVKLPTTIAGEICFSLKDLANIRSWEELLSALEGTPYHDIMAPYTVNDIRDLDFTGLEQDLYRYDHETTLRILNESIDKKSQKAIKELLYSRIELDNIAKIYRLKKYFNTPHDRIMPMLAKVYLRFSKKDIAEMIEKDDAEHIYERLVNSSYKAYVNDERFLFIEHTTKMINYNLNRKQIMFASDPDTVLLAYMRLVENEIDNIVDIIEGVRYRVSSEEIRRMLIY